MLHPFTEDQEVVTHGSMRKGGVAWSDAGDRPVEVLHQQLAHWCRAALEAPDHGMFAMIADKADGAANGRHNDRTIRGTRIALEDAKNANWHMHMLLYGLIRTLMDDVLGQPAQNEQQVRINVLDAPAPKCVGIPAFIDIGP
jgi:hypothetical protein